jgi:hypothetical protein
MLERKVFWLKRKQKSWNAKPNGEKIELKRLEGKAK